MEGEGGITRSIIDELHFSGIQGEQREGESVFARNINEKSHSSDM